MGGLKGEETGTIDGVVLKRLVVHPDERGRLFEVLRSDDPMFRKFGQVYVTTARPGVIKAWHYHKVQTDYFFCIQGTARLVLYDPRVKSPTTGMVSEFIMVAENPALVMIPPNVYHGFQCVSGIEAIMLNIPTEPYLVNAPDEYRLDPYSEEVPYAWPKA